MRLHKRGLSGIEAQSLARAVHWGLAHPDNWGAFFVWVKPLSEGRNHVTRYFEVLMLRDGVATRYSVDCLTDIVHAVAIANEAGN